MLRPIIATIIGVLAFVGFLAGTASAAELPTNWAGSYAYNDGRPPVPFSLTLVVRADAISGRLEEPATFGDGTSDKLRADITGTIRTFNIKFTKTYDGTGGQTHSVAYRGTFDGKAMFGTWGSGDLSGAWYASASPK